MDNKAEMVVPGRGEAGDKRVLELYAYWLTRRDGDALPRRDDIDPVDIPHLLPNLLLVDVLREDTPRFQFRLVGTALSELYGENFTGRYLDEIDAGGLQSVIRQGYLQATQMRVPTFQQGRTDYRHGREIEYSRVVLPLTDGGETVTLLLVGTFFEWPHQTPPILGR